jgi:hypothetical protein
MAASEGIFKRCGCTDTTTGRRLDRACPRLGERGHGTWVLPAFGDEPARSERIRRGGFPSQAAARRARDAWLATTGEERTARSWTVERWLRYWLSTRTTIRPTTKLHYTRDVEHFLIPHLGRLCLADLDVRRLRAAFAQIARTTNSKGQPHSPSCLPAPPTHHPAGRAQPRHPRGTDRREPGPPSGNPVIPQTAPAGMDRRPGR